MPWQAGRPTTLLTVESVPRALLRAEGVSAEKLALIRRIVRTPIDIEQRFHRGREVRVALRRNHPSDALPRLDFIFLEPVTS